jgi:hypothetical protein
MVPALISMFATETCTKTTTTGTIVGFVILLAIIGAVVFFAVANARARSQLATANAELNYLRPENARLQQWLDSLSGAPPAPLVTGGYPSVPPIPSQWYPDPSGRHEFRRWDGVAWTDEVSDKGVTSKDDPQ